MNVRKRIFEVTDPLLALDGDVAYRVPGYVHLDAPIARLAIGSDQAIEGVVERGATVTRFWLPDLGAADARAEALEELGRVPCGGEEQCFFGAIPDRFGWSPVFVRHVPLVSITRDQLQMTRVWRLADPSHLAVPREIDERFSHFVICYRRAVGKSIDALTLSLPLALLLLAEANRGLDALHDQGMTHGALTPKRIRLLPEGRLKLCFGAVAERVAAAAERARLARLILSPALDEPLIESEDEHALEVAFDRILEVRPDLDELGYAALLDRPDDEQLFRLAKPLVSPDEALGLLCDVFEGLADEPWTRPAA